MKGAAPCQRGNFQQSLQRLQLCPVVAHHVGPGLACPACVGDQDLRHGHADGGAQAALQRV